MDFKFTFTDGSEAIAHHGVKGMKWGVRNAETLARYERSEGGGGGGGTVDDEIQKLLEDGDGYSAAIAAINASGGDPDEAVKRLVLNGLATSDEARNLVNSAAESAKKARENYDDYKQLRDAPQSAIEEQRAKNKAEKEERRRRIEQEQQAAKDSGDILWWLRGYE